MTAKLRHKFTDNVNTIRRINFYGQSFFRDDVLTGTADEDKLTMKHSGSRR